MCLIRSVWHCTVSDTNHHTGHWALEMARVSEIISVTDRCLCSPANPSFIFTCIYINTLFYLRIKFFKHWNIDISKTALSLTVSKTTNKTRASKLSLKRSSRRKRRYSRWTHTSSSHCVSPLCMCKGLATHSQHQLRQSSYSSRLACFVDFSKRPLFVNLILTS